MEMLLHLAMGVVWGSEPLRQVCSEEAGGAEGWLPRAWDGTRVSEPLSPGVVTGRGGGGASVCARARGPACVPSVAFLPGDGGWLVPFLG